MRSTLFRQEALDSHRDRQLGDVLLARPVALSLLTTLGALVALAVVLFGFFAEYTRKAHVAGYLAPTHGLIKVHASQSGTLTEKRVEEGRRVARGDALYVLSTERSSPEAGEAQAAAIAQLRERRSSLTGEIERQQVLAHLTQQDLEQRVRAIAAELAQLHAAIATQHARLASSRNTLERHEALALQRFISEAQLAQQREQVLDQQARVQALERSRTALQRDRASVDAALAAHRPKVATERAALERQISALEQEVAEYESRRTVVVTAPADGVVTTILAERGQSVTAGAPLLSIIPEGAALQAQLLVPSRAAGFLATGQPVALRYQAFPFQRFGSSRGVVKEISRTPIAPGDTPLPVALNEPAYRVTVALDQQAVRAYRKEFPLQAGMLLDADIALDRRRLVDWLFEPLVAVAGRV
ncbi:MAG TPA: HlyD family efflux transporter periplasmic adaptor subunit [Burkholderiaceae bacterium]|nr:HlyD family efflux transporter periplasmic adaptor subunit [Burkholderiaceae bacterium]